MRTWTATATAALLGAFSLTIAQAEKVPLEEPAPGAELAAEMRDLPDGINRVRVDPDGAFKSLVVKATVEIDTVLGAAKGKQIALKEAQTRCKAELARWLEEHCVFAETQNKVTTIITKGEEARDAAGNVVKLRSQEGKEWKVFTESAASHAEAVLRGLITLSAEVSDENEQELALIMGLSQENMDKAAAVSSALSGNTGAPKPKSPNPSPAPTDRVPAGSKVSTSIGDF